MEEKMARKEKCVMVNVNDLAYKLKLTTRNNSELGENCRGKIWYEKLKIFLDKDNAPRVRLYTYYHELAHAMIESTSFNDMLMEKLGDHGYEIFVDKLGEAVYNYINKNNTQEIEDFVKGDEIESE